MPTTPRFVSAALIIAIALTCIPIPTAAQQVVGERIYILGAVNHPGDFEFKPGMSVKDAIELAGGLAPNADPSGAVLVRANKEMVALNLKAILEGKETVLLSGGDTVAIKPGTVRVEGQVKKPEVIDLKPGMTAADALALAGGPTETGDVAAAYIMRNGTTLSANLGEPSSAVALQPNDVLTVPQISASITGEVNQPGTYAIIPGKTDTLEALIQAAGGPTSKADLKRVRISTTKGAERPTVTVDASDPAVRQSTKIRSGDAVFIPQVEKRKHRISLSEVYQIILIVYTLIQIFGN